MVYNESIVSYQEDQINNTNQDIGDSCSLCPSSYAYLSYHGVAENLKMTTEWTFFTQFGTYTVTP